MALSTRDEDELMEIVEDIQQYRKAYIIGDIDTIEYKGVLKHKCYKFDERIQQLHTLGISSNEVMQYIPRDVYSLLIEVNTNRQISIVSILVLVKEKVCKRKWFANSIATLSTQRI